MRLVRTLARPMLAGPFVVGGLDAFRKPEPRAAKAAPVIDRMTDAMPIVAPDPITLVQVNAAAQVVAGGALALGVLPRLAALVLAGSLVPTTFGGHRFWEIADSGQRSQQQTHFLKNAAMLGGLLVVALD